MIELTGRNVSRLLGQTKGEPSFDALGGIWSEDCLNQALAGIGN